MIRSSNVRWLTYREDAKYWEVWDKKEEFMKRHSRSKTREMDRIRSLDRGRDADYRSRSRSRGRSKHFTHDLVIVSLCDDGNKCFIVQQLFWYCIKK